MIVIPQTRCKPNPTRKQTEILKNYKLNLAAECNGAAAIATKKYYESWKRVEAGEEQNGG